MSYWLIKSEPSVYSFADMQRDGITFWDGVRNYQAANYMKNMKKGDLCLFYHSNEEKAVVGTVKVIKEFYPDKKDELSKFGNIDVAYVKPLKKPVTLAEIKADPKLAAIGLVRQSRLSVMPISKAHWDLINKKAV